MPMITAPEFKQKYRERYLQSTLTSLEWFERKIKEVALALQEQGLVPPDLTLEEIVSLQPKPILLELDINNYQHCRNCIQQEEETSQWIYATLSPTGLLECQRVAFIPTMAMASLNSTRTIERVLSTIGIGYGPTLDNAEMMIYWGRYLCDYRNDGTEIPVIDALLQKIKSSDTPAVFFFIGGDVERHCYPHCPEPKEIYQLQKEGKKIALIPRATI